MGVGMVGAFKRIKLTTIENSVSKAMRIVYNDSYDAVPSFFYLLGV
jgi:hypothetical protein